MGLPPGVKRPTPSQSVTSLDGTDKTRDGNFISASRDMPGMMDRPPQEMTSVVPRYSSRCTSDENVESSARPVTLERRLSAESLSSAQIRAAWEDASPEPMYHEGWTAQVVQSRVFENATLLVIAVNAIWIGVDLEDNNADIWINAEFMYQFADNFFCTYFTMEVVLRFFALRCKLKFWRNKVYLFDLFLVGLMVSETWIFVLIVVAFAGSGSNVNLGQLSVLRLLRLLRLTRMARLMRAFPEILTLVRGMVSAVRSVASTFLFQVAITWVYGIIFTISFKAIPMDDSSEEYKELYETYFKSLLYSCVTLYMNGTLLDNVGVVGGLLGKHDPILMIVYFTYVLLSSVTLMNMLIGLLTGVVSETAEAEERKLRDKTAHETLEAVFEAVDVDGSRTISHSEFDTMLADHKSPMMQVLASLGIPSDRLQEISTQIFELQDRDIYGEEMDPELTFEQFTDKLMNLRPGVVVSIRDIRSLRQCATKVAEAVPNALSAMDAGLRSMESLEAPFLLEQELTDDCRKTVQPSIKSLEAPFLLEQESTRVSSGADLSKALHERTVSSLADVPTQVIVDEVLSRLGSGPLQAQSPLSMAPRSMGGMHSLSRVRTR